MREFLSIICALLTGWAACGWWYGVYLTSDSAELIAQVATEQGIAATREIDAKNADLKSARDRVRVVVKEKPVYVDKNCPAGTVPVSDDAAERLLLALAADAAAAEKLRP